MNASSLSSALFCVVLGLQVVSTPTFAQDTPTPTAAQIRSEINTVGDQIRAKLSESIKLQNQVKQAALNPKLTSPNIEKKRAQIQSLEQELLKARIELQNEVQTLPEVKELAEKSRALSDEVTALRKQKKTLAEKLAQCLNQTQSAPQKAE